MLHREQHGATGRVDDVGETVLIAVAFLGVKVAFDKAAAAVGGRPSTEDVIAAFEYLEWDGLSGTVRMALGKGHQAILEIAVGVSRYDTARAQSMVTDVVRFDAECVNPPAGWTSADWIEAGFPGAKCN